MVSKADSDNKDFKYVNCLFHYKKTDEWYIEWQRVVQRVTTNDNEWQQMTTSGTTSENEWYNKWQRMTTSDKKCLFRQIFLFFE